MSELKELDASRDHALTSGSALEGHTPGPWYALRDRVVSEATWDTVAVFYGDADKMRTLGLNNEPATPKERANARLIAAAPELLEALKAYRAAQPQCECTEHSGCSMATARALADAIISKAEGAS